MRARLVSPTRLWVGLTEFKVDPRGALSLANNDSTIAAGGATSERISRRFRDSEALAGMRLQPTSRRRRH